MVSSWSRGSRGRSSSWRRSRGCWRSSAVGPRGDEKITSRFRAAVSRPSGVARCPSSGWGVSSTNHLAGSASGLSVCAWSSSTASSYTASSRVDGSRPPARVRHHHALPTGVSIASADHRVGISAICAQSGCPLGWPCSSSTTIAARPASRNRARITGSSATSASAYITSEPGENIGRWRLANTSRGSSLARRMGCIWIISLGWNGKPFDSLRPGDVERDSILTPPRIGPGAESAAYQLTRPSRYFHPKPLCAYRKSVATGKVCYFSCVYDGRKRCSQRN